MEKRGQSNYLTLIIVVILGVAVLAVIIFGFTTGWGNLWDKFTNFGGGKANLDSIQSGCQVACETKSVSAYCNQGRTVKLGEKMELTRVYEAESAEKAENENITYVKKSDEVRNVYGTCNDFANSQVTLRNVEKSGESPWVKGTETQVVPVDAVPGLNVAKCPSLCS